MTDAHDGAKPGFDPSDLTKEEVQRRVEALLAESSEKEQKAESRRKRLIPAVILILLLLLLGGIGAFVYRVLSPGAGADKKEAAGVTWVRSIYGFGPAENQQFINPNDAVTAPDGTIWVADTARSRVVGFRGDGTYTGSMLRGSQNTGQPFRLPSRLAVDGDGLVYVVDIPNEQLTIMDGQTKLATANIPGVTSVDVNDQMIVVGSNSGFAILDKDGKVQKIVGKNGQGDNDFDRVAGVAIDSASKSIYVVDTYNNRLSAWDYAGKRKWIVTTGNKANKVKLEGGGSLVTTTSVPAALQLPSDVTIDGKGRPIVLDSFGFQLAAFDPKDGAFVGSWGAPGDKDGQFMYPATVSYDASKDWFVVADTSNRRAEIIRLPGTARDGSGVVSALNRLLAGPLRALWPCLALLPLIVIALLVSRWRARRAANKEEGVEVPVEAA